MQTLARRKCLRKHQLQLLVANLLFVPLLVLSIKLLVPFIVVGIFIFNCCCFQCFQFDVIAVALEVMVFFVFFCLNKKGNKSNKSNVEQSKPKKKINKKNKTSEVLNSALSESAGLLVIRFYSIHRKCQVIV